MLDTVTAWKRERAACLGGLLFLPCDYLGLRFFLNCAWLRDRTLSLLALSLQPGFLDFLLNYSSLGISTSCFICFFILLTQDHGQPQIVVELQWQVRVVVYPVVLVLE